MSTEISMNLRYHVVITRKPGENWPQLVTGSAARYDVTKVAVTVWLNPGTGELTADQPSFLLGRRILKNGTLGMKTAPDYDYSSSRHDGSPLDKKSIELRTQALREAGRMHAALTGKDAAGIFREDALARDRAAFLREQGNQS